MNTAALMQFLSNPDPAMMDQLATQLANNPQMAPPPPGSLQQAKSMMAMQGGGGYQFGPQGGPQGPDLGTLLGGTPPVDLVNPAPGTLQEGILGGPTGAPGGVALSGFAPRQEPQETEQDRMAKLGRAAAALALQNRSQGQGAYFNPPVTGAAKLAPGFQAPGRLGQAPLVPSLGQFL
jgi:hypothetical protein